MLICTIMGEIYLVAVQQKINKYRRLPIIQTFKGNRKKFDSSGLQVI